MPEPVRRMEIFTGSGRRRTWSVANKAAIVAESYGSGETVCGVARRHGLSPQQLFTWRRQARSEAMSAVDPAFVTAVIDVAGPAISQERTPPGAMVSGIELRIGDVEMRIGPDARASTIAAVIRALKATS
jgi:transposase